MANISGTPQPLMRIDVSRSSQYLYPEPPKLSFMQKFGRGLGKAVSFLGPIGGAVAAIALPGIGIPIAAGLYGLSKVSGDMVSRSYQKEAIQVQAQQQQIAQTQVTTPGLFEDASQADMATDFIAPSEFGPSIQNTIVNREMARGNALQSF